MSVDQIPTREAPRPDATKLVRYEDFIESKIQSTRSMVKVVDLATAMLTLTIGVLAYLLVIAMAEHWIVPGGFSVIERTGLFAVLLVSIGYFAYKRVWPPLVRAINPVYAAQAIEHGSPALKNSLINLLFFRERRTGISESVYRTLEEQAAQRLTRVPIETSVDRSLLIRLGYVLVAIVALAGLYKVLSPKDPIVSAGRVLLPWADIVPASRVSIGAVTPGSVTISRGEFVDVSAEVRGLGDDEEIVARYTTDDGQVVGRAIPMRPAGDGLRYTCRLSEDGMGAEVGLTRDLRYRLEAGDARSLDYAVTVVSAPSILVERVDYHYPPYTGFVDRSVDSLGDIRAIEGTRMTVHARANGEIRVADVDFDADGRPDVRMNIKETGANASFELGLREDRVTPRHASYVLRFTNDEGRANRDPVKHSIAVERDLDPEAAVLLPKERAIDVRLDETVPIEIEARDPDFSLAGVRLHGEVSHQSMLDESLLKGEHRGKFMTRYTFSPTAHGLKIGDIVQYWVEATDNRAPKANTVTTERRTIRIVSPNPGQPHQPPQDRVARNDRQQPQPGEQQDGEQKQGGDKNEGGQQRNQGEQNQGDKQGQNDRGDQQQGESGGAQQSGKNDQQQNGENQQGGQGNNSGEQNGAGDQQQSQEKSNGGGEGQGEQSQGDNQQGNEQKSGKQGQGGGQSKSGNDSSDQEKKDGEQNGSAASGGGQSKDSSQSKGDRNESGDKSQQPNGQPQGSKNDGSQQKGEQGQSSEQKPAVSSEGDNDGEAFDRIRKRMEQTGDLNKDAADQQGEKGNEAQGEKANQQQGGKQGEQDGSSGKEQGANDAAQQDGKQPQDGKAGGKNGDDQQGKQGAGDQQQGGKSASDKSDSADGKSAGKPDGADQKQQPGEQGKDSQQGAGSKESGDGAKDPGKEGQQGQQEGQKEKSSPNGDAKSKGAGGAGDEQQPQGSPNSQPDMKPTDKHQQSPSNAKDGSNKSEPPSGARGKKESDSAGDQGGDKAGGGEEGAGQKSPRDGTGSAGQNQSADNGAGQSGEQGKGDTSSSGGQDKQADGKTGSSDGKTKGDGSEKGVGSREQGAGSRKGDQADSEGKKEGAGGNEEGARDPAQQDGKQQQDGKAGSKGGSEQSKDGKSDAGKEGEQGSKEGKSSGQPEGGGSPGGAADPQSSITGTAPEGDAANLDYARKQTDLVLNKLADQLNKNKVDDRMLKELGWTRDDLRRFVERWQQRKDAAKTEDAKGEAAKRELDDALRSLGLQQGKLEQNAVQKDTMRDLKQGYRGAVPLEYKERLRAYNQGVSRANRDGE